MYQTIQTWFISSLIQLLHESNYSDLVYHKPYSASPCTKPFRLGLSQALFSLSMYQTIQTWFIQSLIQLLHVPNHSDSVYPKPCTAFPCTKPFRLGLSKALFSFSMYQTIQTGFIPSLIQFLHESNHSGLIYPKPYSASPCTEPFSLGLSQALYSLSMYQTIQTRFIPSLIQLLHVPNHSDSVYPKPYSASPCTKPFRLGLSQALFSFSMYQTIQTWFIPSLIQLLHVPNHPDSVYHKPDSPAPYTKPSRLSFFIS